MSHSAITSSVALEDLKSDLMLLSENLKEVHSDMKADMTNVGEFWQDAKYQDFINGFQPQIDRCLQIATRYEEWCKTVLQTTIDNAVAIEQTNVTGDGAGVSSSGASVATNTSGVSDAGVNAQPAGDSLASKFNMG